MSPELIHGLVKITLPDGMELPDKAGKLSTEEIKRIPGCAAAWA